ncbi:MULTISPECIES: hypothetical protein [Sphingobacterium]|uniref:Uncharacterized protein n=1 Tax=Sphingobacterium detergens TaxID=1145106 RepID=A0A420AXI7_SPHD1|nr:MULTISPECIES: hypothetical protein [Sphingobacterium]MCS4225197.1 hypothetical protein [Sphingobacterium sp. BIGb0165]RKE49234.1 hypothetical protein DFQ12_3345 [Sphingobacterium detergens]
MRTKIIVFCVFSCVLFGCKKSDSVSNEENSKTEISKEEEDKVFELRKFLSETWERPVENVIYNGKDSIFTLRDSEIVEKRSHVEHFYNLLKK